MKELWKPVINYENDYEVSSTGFVRNVKTDKLLGNNRINKGRGSKFGYVRVNLKGRNFYLHKLVAEAFIPNPLNKKYVDHLDGNSLNNKVSNLKWVTAKENNQNPITCERRKAFNDKRKQETIIRRKIKQKEKADRPKIYKPCKAKYYYKNDTLSHYCKLHNLDIYTVRDRINKLGMTIEEAVSKPLLTQREKVLKRYGKFNWENKTNGDYTINKR